MRIEACTRALASGRVSGRQLALLFDERGVNYGGSGDYDRAIADFNEAMRLDPTLWVAFFHRGFACERQKKFELALADFTEAQRLAPDNPDISAAVARARAELVVKSGPSVKSMGSDDIHALQQRLASDGCYQGAIDSQPSPTLDVAIKTCPTQDPVLRIETGMHVANVLGISTDAACKIIATTSLDKTTRIWSAKDRHLLRTLRVPIGNGNGGASYAVAVSPDGRYIAVAGSDAWLDVTDQSFAYVFDAATGAMVARLFGSNSVIDNVAFSQDGRWLAIAGAGDQSGVRVYDTADWHLSMSDLLFGHKDVDAITFGPDGSLYAAGYDGRMRRYGPGPDFPKERVVAIPGGSQPGTIAADPRGELVAVGFTDSRSISLLEAATLRFRSFADTSVVHNGVLGAVSWDAKGESLFAGGTYDTSHGVGFVGAVLVFDRRGRRIGETAGFNDTIQQMRPCGSGVALSGHGFGLIDGAGRLEWSALATVDMRGKVGNAFTMSLDARQIRFGLDYAPSASPGDAPIVDPVVFDLTRGTLGGAPQLVPGFVAPDTTTLPIDGWYNERPTYAGRPLDLNEAETARAVAIRSHRDGFVLGTSSRLLAYAQDGSERWEGPGPSETMGVNISADGLIVVAAYSDGTIRWHRWSDGRELLALFVDKADKRWIAWTPSGYYMASPGGEDLIGWHVNRGWNQAADFFPASRFREKFSRPDIVRLVLDTLDEDAAVKQANRTAQRKGDSKPLINELPPVINIKGPAPEASVATPEVRIDYTWRSPSGQPVDRIAVLIDGRPVKEIGLPLRASSQDAEVPGSLQVALRHRDNDVSLIAWSGDRSSVASKIKVLWSGAPAPKGASRKLFAFIVGVSTYAQPDMALHYAAKDAGDFAAALAAQKGGYYSDVQTRLVTDHDVTRAHLIQGLKWLSQVATSPDDVSVLFLAGHGLTDASQTYWFLPSDASGDDFDATGVSQEEIRRYLQTLPGKVVWFLDTCHAGSAAKRPPVDMNLLVNKVTAAENGGIVAFASSRGREVSVENSSWQNGAFTKALLEGIGQGKADLTLEGKITTSLLDFYLEKRVQELTDGKQNPVMGRPPEEPDFVIAGAGAP